MHAALASLLLLAALSDRPDLTGTVTDPGGSPVAGASVFIHSAGVREGTGVFCPSCYPDCAKRATTDADGRFLIPSVDPELHFKVLVVADGRPPVFAEKVIPEAGPLAVVSSVRDLARIPPTRLLRGRVVDEHGKPVVGATVEPRSFRTAEYRGFKPGVFDPLAVTGLDGRFALVSRSEIESVMVRVEGPRLAPMLTERLPPVPEGHVVTLRQGSFVTGRVTRDGAPLAGLPLCLVQVDRGSDAFLGPKEIGTDARGVFLFSNVQPGEYVLHGLAGHMPEGTTLGLTRVAIGDGTVEVGTLEAKPGGVLRGRVVLADGKPAPAGTRVGVSMDEAWDTSPRPPVELDADGRFEARGLPPGLCTVSVRVPGYRYSAKNRSLDPLRGSLRGRLGEREVDRLTILLEPGEPVRDPRLDGPGPGIPKEVSKELRRIEASPLEGVPIDEVDP